MFVYGYCFYYYYARSGMSGFMQTSFFFGYNLMVSLASLACNISVIIGGTELAASSCRERQCERCSL